MAEIRAARNIWNDAKHQLCWWHLRKAIRERTAKSKLTTTPYNAKRANAAFDFIELLWRPRGKGDVNEREGEGIDEDDVPIISPPTTQSQANPNALPRFRLPGRLANREMEMGERAAVYVQLPTFEDELETDDDGEEMKGRGRRFCPEEYRSNILDMVELHLHSHPSIPASRHAPSAEGIHYWAVKQMYTFCRRHDLVEVWAYLWENWYRDGRWQLWARAQCAEIPRLKTTMICESQ